MFKDKIVKVFDESIVKRGSFITYARMGAGDDGEKEVLYRQNAIIKSVGGGYFSVTLAGGDVKKIDVDDILDGDIRILGIIDTAIDKSVKQDTVELIKKEVEDARNSGNQVAESYADGIVYASELLGLEIE